MSCNSSPSQQRCHICLDVFQHGPWRKFRALQNPHLRELAWNLKSLVMMDRAQSTVKKYCLSYSSGTDGLQDMASNPSLRKDAISPCTCLRSFLQQAPQVP